MFTKQVQNPLFDTELAVLVVKCLIGVIQASVVYVRSSISFS